MPLHRSALLLLLVLPPPAAAARDYYVSAAGNDSRDGTAAEPWRTLAKVNATNLQPGDRVLLEGGRTFSGPDGRFRLSKPGARIVFVGLAKPGRRPHRQPECENHRLIV